MYGIFVMRGVCYFVKCSVNNGSVGVEYDGWVIVKGFRV